MNEEAKKKINKMWEKYKDNKDVLFLLSRLANLEIKLIDADVMAMCIDVTTRRKLLDERSLIADARLSYGTPWEYNFAKKDYLLRWRGGIEEVIEVLSKKK